MVDVHESMLTNALLSTTPDGHMVLVVKVGGHQAVIPELSIEGLVKFIDITNDGSLGAALGAGLDIRTPLDGFPVRVKTLAKLVMVGHRTDDDLWLGFELDEVPI